MKFSQDNTEGFTDEQLDDANDLYAAAVKKAAREDGEADWEFWESEHKSECDAIAERILDKY